MNPEQWSDALAERDGSGPLLGVGRLTIHLPEPQPETLFAAVVDEIEAKRAKFVVVPRETFYRLGDAEDWIQLLSLVGYAAERMEIPGRDTVIRVNNLYLVAAAAFLPADE